MHAIEKEAGAPLSHPRKHSPTTCAALCRASPFHGEVRDSTREPGSGRGETPGSPLRSRRRSRAVYSRLIAFVRFLDARARFAEAERRAALNRERESQFRSIESQIDLYLSKTHDIGWRHRLDALVDRAAAIRGGADLRDVIVPTLPARSWSWISSWTTSGLRQSHSIEEGDRLVLGGLNESDRRKKTDAGSPGGPAKESRFSCLERTRCGRGRIRSPRSRTPVHRHRPGKAVVSDIEKDQAVTLCEFPRDWKVAASAISGDGSLVALAISHGPESGEVRVWRVVDGRQRLRYGRVASALAFSPDGGLLADGDRAGWVEVRQIDSGRRVAKLFDRRHLGIGVGVRSQSTL